MIDERDEVAVDLTEDLEELEDLMEEFVTEVTLLDDDLLVLVPDGTEHSLTPPGVRAPKVASEQMKLPDSTLYWNTSARPNATFVAVATEQLFPSLQIVM